MLACAIGDCNIDVFIRVVEATEKGNYFKVLYIHVLMDLPNGDCSWSNILCNNSNFTNFLHFDWLFERFYTLIKAMRKDTLFSP